MAKLNLMVLNSVLVNDVVVTGRASIGTQRGNRQALAHLSQRWPVSTGPEPMQPRLGAELPKAKAYRDPNPTRAGRSDRFAGYCLGLGHTARTGSMNAGKRPASSAR